MRILQVGDRQTWDRRTRQSSGFRGTNSEHVQSGEEALELLVLYEYDIVLLRLELAGTPGQEVLRRMRAGKIQTPVVVLADTATPETTVDLLDLGADDVVGTPITADELFARIRAIVRRSQGHAKSALQIGPVELDLRGREVRVDGEKLHLTPKEYAVLELLFLRQGVVQNKESFLNHLYAGTDGPEMKTIDVIICKLRTKLAVARISTLIRTVRGHGYILQDPSAERHGDFVRAVTQDGFAVAA